MPQYCDDGAREVFHGEGRLRPIVFLDFDDVICLNRHYGAYDVFAPDPPDELWQQLFHPPAIAVLQALTDEFDPHFVLTTSWLLRMDRGRCDDILKRSGLNVVADALHPHWQAPPSVGRTRLEAVELWLAAHHCGEPFAVIDDELSGVGLGGSRFDAEGRVVLCRAGEGLHRGYLSRLQRALGTPPRK